MRGMIQRVARAEVRADGKPVGQIGKGLLVYIGPDDDEAHARKLAEKVSHLRIFEDDQDKLNLSVRDIAGGVLAVPNFTLMADARKGRRPAFVGAARPEQARPLFQAFVAALEGGGFAVAAGVFGAHMVIRSDADGPVNILLDVPG
jgi:D-tyrosyl-tRNA(Tyr) deacylase